MVYDNDKDSFWDLDKLVPKKTPLYQFSTKEKTVTVVTEGGPDAHSDRLKLTLPADTDSETADSGVTEYRPEGGLIKRVTVKHKPDKFDFHANFVKAGEIYYDFKGQECDFASFYSYMPQYTQLNQAQKNYYFYWRSMVRKNKLIKTDYSYFYLYVYEILNLSDKMPREEALKLLIKLWREYRGALPNIDSNMALWVQDFCLVYNLPCPMDEIKDFVFDVMGASGFKEFYLSDAETLGKKGVSSLIAYLSDYDWRRGKYAGGDNKEAYSSHLIGAMGLVISRLFDGGKILSENETVTLSRSAFRSALTTASIKYKIEVEYRPMSTESELRDTVTSALKYTENKLRALMGVKSRLAVKELAPEYKAIVDRYFEELFEEANRERIRASRPEYEKLYEAESTGLSALDADEIERTSWSTTARLVETDGEEYSEPEPDIPPEITESSEDSRDTYGLDADRVEFVSAALLCDTGKMKEICDRVGMLADAIADEINEAFVDGFGDVVLEECDGEYRVIEDYREDVETWLHK